MLKAFWMVLLSIGSLPSFAEELETQGDEDEVIFDDLSLDQTEVLADLSHGYGIGLLTTAPFQLLSIYYQNIYNPQMIGHFQYGYGAYEIEFTQEGSLSTQDLKTHSLHHKLIFFPKNELPFYFGLGTSVVSFASELQTVSSDHTARASRHDTGLALSGHLGFMWVTDSHISYGIDIMNVTRSWLIVKGSGTGSPEQKKKMTEQIQGTFGWMGLSLNVGILM